MEKKLKLYFLGSGSVGVESLRQLYLDGRIELVGVGTQIDKPSGRSRTLTPTPFGMAARELGLSPDKPADVNDPDFLSALRLRDPDMVLVISFGQMLKGELLNLPRLGCINVHTSLLPRYRGASPITSAIRDRETKTGISVMKMAKGMDTGDVYTQIEYPLYGDETGGVLERELGSLCSRTLPEILLKIAAGDLSPVPQNHDRATVCRKIAKADGVIDWDRSAADIDAAIRAYNPWPGAQMTLQSSTRELRLTVNYTRVLSDVNGHGGEIISCGKKGLIIGAGSGGALEIVSVTPAGKKPMSGAAFCNGCDLTNYHVLKNLQKPL